MCWARYAGSEALASHWLLLPLPPSVMPLTFLPPSPSEPCTRSLVPCFCSLVTSLCIHLTLFSPRLCSLAALCRAWYRVREDQNDRFFTMEPPRMYRKMSTLLMKSKTTRCDSVGLSRYSLSSLACDSFPGSSHGHAICCFLPLFQLPNAWHAGVWVTHRGERHARDWVCLVLPVSRLPVPCLPCRDAVSARPRI